MSGVAPGFVSQITALVSFFSFFKRLVHFFKYIQKKKTITEKATVTLRSASDWIFAQCDIEQMSGLDMQMLYCTYIIKGM